MVNRNPHPKLNTPPLRQVAFIAVINTKIEFINLRDSIVEKYIDDFPFRQVSKKITYEADDKGNLNVEEKPPLDYEPHFRISNGHSNISIGPQFFGLDIDETYGGWENFSTLLSNLITMVYERGAKGFNFVSLRFENELCLSGSIDETLAEWLTPKSLPFEDATNPFAFTIELTNDFDDGVQSIKVEYPLVEELKTDGSECVYVSIDLSLVPEDGEEEMSCDDLLDWIEIAHERIYNTFQAAWNPKTLEGMK